MNILLLGANGQVGWELQHSLAPIGKLKVCDRREVNLEDLDGLRALIREYMPNVIVNAAAYTAVDKAESESDRARRVNSDAVACLAEEASRANALLIHYSSDYVFDGEKSTPYTECDHPNPLNVYGSTKWQGEEAIRQSACKHFIFRTSWVYSARNHNFVKTMLHLAANREELSVVSDQIGTPTHANLIATVTSLSLRHYQSVKQAADQADMLGTYNLVASGETSWCDYAHFVLKQAALRGMKLSVKADEITPIPSDAYPLAAARPKNSRLSCAKLESTFNLQMPDWRLQVTHVVKELIEQASV